jgi:predicted O-methyltransferase YrrM
VDIAAFLTDPPTLWVGNPQTADVPRDRRFARLLWESGGMATENRFTLLNLAARHLAPGEVYLEIGAYLGTSIAAAAMGNDDKKLVTVDKRAVKGLLGSRGLA